MRPSGCTFSGEPTGRLALDDDAVLIDQARSGDPDAYAGLVERYQDVAFRTAYLITRDATEAEDATQEAFIKAFGALDRFEHGRPFRPWVLRIVANEARNRRKAAARRATLPLRMGRFATSSDGPLDMLVLADEARRDVWRGLARLRSEEQLVIACRFFLELSEEESAHTLGCPRGTVKSRLSRALAHLRGWLADGEAPASDPLADRSTP
jgi:RNA polymerase sigma-70 factor (ECF subfamily)